MSHPDAIAPGVAADSADTHNASAQLGVERNPDPILDLSNEHRHPHLHHGSTALPEGKDDLLFAKSDENYNPAAVAPSYKVRPMSSNEDEESGGVGGIRGDKDEDEKAGWTFKRFYRKFKLVFHVAIWGVWTA